MLATEHSNINILCFTEHWLSEVQLKVLNIEGFRLVSSFSRSHSASGGSCIFIRNTIETKDVNYLRDLGKENVFEISAIELPDNSTIIACIYRSPDSDFYTFLYTLEWLIFKVSSKGKRLVLCGDLNVNFLQHNNKLVDLQNLLVMNNLTNIVKSPTRISDRSVSLIDVMIVDNTDNEMFTVNQDLGYSDHLAQLLYMKSKNLLKGPITKHKRHFTDKNIEEFQYLLHKENWEEVTTSDEPNISFNIFMDTLSYYFNTAFPLKITHVNNSIINTWITKGIIISRNKLRLLCNIKRSMNLSMKSLKHIQNYQRIYRKVLTEAKKREADRLILSATNKNKTLWKIINKETGNSQQKPNIIINAGDKVITNPQMITEKFSSYFTEVIEDLLSQVNHHRPQQHLKFQTKNCPETMFIAPVTKTELILVIKGLKNNSSAGFDEIPTFLVKQCLCHFIKPLAHIYNVSFQTGTFPDMMKTAKVKPLYKKKNRQDIQNYRPISILSVFSKLLEKLMYNRLKHN